ncbi:MAG: molybdopterin molybdenumtransferase MoeA, partial [Bacteroidetes bacterium]|nr:molybdopterin molybdenumtransferase MoeA [Bacteroidota bacterium]
FAVQSHDLKDAPKQLQLIEQLMAGKEATRKVVSGTCIQIMTGAPVPPGADSVVKVEVTEVIGEMIQFNTDEVKTGQNIAKQGEDATLGQKLVDKGVFCGPAEIGALAVTGMHRVKVYRLPEVAIISTGDEIVEVSQIIQPQQIRDSNRYVLQSFF